MSDPLNINASPAQIVETTRTVFVRNLVIPALIGVYDHELTARQPVRINLDLDVQVTDKAGTDELDDAVCYNKMTVGIRSIVDAGHIRLVETLAERIAAFALAHPLVNAVIVRVEKPHAIDDAEAAGVEIRRRRV